MRTSNMNKYGCEMGCASGKGAWELVALGSAASMRRKIYALMRQSLARYAMGRCRFLEL